MADSDLWSTAALSQDCACPASNVAFASPLTENDVPVDATDHVVGGYREVPPPAYLAFAVEALWTHEAAPHRTTIHRVVPDPAVSLCFTGVRDANGPGSSRLFLIGPVANARMFAPDPGSHMSSVRIKLEWCRALLGVAPGEHEDAEYPYALALPTMAVPLEDRLARTPTPADVLRVLVDFLRARATAAQAARRESCMPAPALVSVAMEMLRISAGRLRLGALSAQLGVTDRHLRRAILAETSISPRRFARVQRFHALLRDADRAADPGWAALAARHGYADQSHLIRELQALAGVTPGQLLAERRAEPAAESDAAAVRTAAATG